MPLSNLPGPWRWEDRGDRGWWRVHQTLDIEDGPHTWNELNMGFGGFEEEKSPWYDRQGEPIPMLVASQYLADEEYKRVAYDMFMMGETPVEVSTVWLGLDHNHLGSLFPDLPYRPKIFETMIFGGDLDLEQWRYSTEEEALAGHTETCRLVAVIAAAMSTKGGDNDNPGGRSQSD